MVKITLFNLILKIRLNFNELSGCIDNNLMKTIAYFVQLFVISLLLLACSKNGEFRLLDGKDTSLDDYSGQWLVINFWAEWCAPCLEEIPELNLIHKEREAYNVSVIGVSYDPIANEELIARVKKLGFEYPVMATNPVPILPFSLPQSLPTNYIIDPSGQVAAKLIGTQTHESLIEALKKAKQAMVKKDG